MNAPTPSPARLPLLSLDDARERLLSQVEPLSRVEKVSTFEADGRVLAADLVSAWSLIHI